MTVRELSKAISIFEDIENPQYSLEEKATAIKMVLDMPTKNSITKDSICKAFNWIMEQFFEWDGEQE